MRIIGLDPGLQRTGWGVIDFKSGKPSHIENGVCISSIQKTLAERLAEIFSQLESVFLSHHPDVAAIEKTFVNKDVAGALKLGHARAMSLLVPARLGIDVFEYAPNEIKKAIVGVGHADKSQVEAMVRVELSDVIIRGADAADALSVALCHAYKGEFERRLKQSVARAES